VNVYNELIKEKSKKIPNDIEKLMKEIYMQPRNIKTRSKITKKWIECT
jgi:hypothetical protein